MAARRPPPPQSSHTQQRLTPCLQFEAPHKRSIEEIAGQQYSAAEPGGELGWQDPGVKPAATHRPELAIDAGLRSALQPLLLRVRAGLAERHGAQAGEQAARGAARCLQPCTADRSTQPPPRNAGGTSPRDIGMAAVAAAEASGALPPLAGPQRVAVEAFFSRWAGQRGLLGFVACSSRVPPSAAR